MKKLLTACAILVSAFMMPAHLSAQTFVQAASFQQMINGGALDWGDYDHDGDVDLLVAVQHDTTNAPITAFIYRNDGNDVFTEFLVNSFPIQYFFAEEGKLVDMDNDGWVDIVMSLHGASSNAIVVLKNNGAGGFLASQTLVPSATGKIACADIDLDGDQDMAVSAYYSVKVYRNDGNMVFTNIDGTQANIQGELCFGNINGDSYPDLVASGQTSNIGDYHTYVFRNDAGIGFTSMIDLGDLKGPVSMADADGDNDDDLLLTGNSGYNTPITNVYINNGNFVLDSISPAPTGLHGPSGWLDADQDGDMDFLCSGYFGQSPNNLNQIMLFTNNGNAVFSETLLSPPLPLERGAVAIADYNNDSYPDFALMGQAGSSYVIPRVIKNMLFTAVEENNAEKGFDCYPSPTTGTVNLLFKQQISAGTLTVCDVTGKILKTQQLQGGTNFVLDLSSLASGVYIIRVTDSRNTFVERIVKQ